MNINVDIALYMNKLSAFFEKNDEASAYFFDEETKHQFFSLVNKFAEENYKERGEPTLSMAQFITIKYEIDARRTNISKEIVKRMFISEN